MYAANRVVSRSDSVRGWSTGRDAAGLAVIDQAIVYFRIEEQTRGWSRPAVFHRNPAKLPFRRAADTHLGSGLLS